ncbi:MAG: AAC(3) family N-acetyltransferase [Crocinitomicaceae bacterium]|nr:AAC(3) family N-acetyltransferase [Crocinitomicaceae bacterium]
MKTIDSNIPFEEIPFHLGLSSTDTVFISSDIKNFALKAKKEGKSIDINLFIDNFQEVLKEGTLIIPAYTDYLKNGDTFDYKKGKPSTGAVSNKVFKRNDFARTKDPLHSVFIWGNAINELKDCEDESTFGQHSIYAALLKKKCIFLFFDVHIVNSFTYVHHVEEYLNVPYRHYQNWTINCQIDGDKTVKSVKFHTKKAGIVTDFDALNNDFFQQKAMQRLNYAGIFIDKINAEDATRIITEKIQKKEYLYRFSWIVFIKTIIKKLIGK